MNYRSIFLLLSLTFVLMASSVMAQDDPGGDPDVPFDGGLGILAAVAAGYGMKKKYDAGKQKPKR